MNDTGDGVQLGGRYSVEVSAGSSSDQTSQSRRKRGWGESDCGGGRSGDGTSVRREGEWTASGREGSTVNQIEMVSVTMDALPFDAAKHCWPAAISFLVHKADQQQ